VQNIFTLHRYRDFRVGVFYSDSPCVSGIYTCKLAQRYFRNDAQIFML